MVQKALWEYTTYLDDVILFLLLIFCLSSISCLWLTVSLPVLQLLSPSIGPPGHLVAHVQQGPAGVHSPGLRPSNTRGPSHPLIHLKDLSSFFFHLIFYLSLWVSFLFTSLISVLWNQCLILNLDCEQDEYFWPFSLWVISPCFLEQRFFAIYRILCVYPFPLISKYNDILPYCSAWCAVLAWFSSLPQCLWQGSWLMTIRMMLTGATFTPPTQVSVCGWLMFSFIAR